MKKVKNKPRSDRAERSMEVRQSEIGIVLDQKGHVVAGIVNLVFGVILSLLALRFVLRLLGANPANAFANFIYSLSQPLVSPFFGLFNYRPELASAHLEVETVVALLVYGLIAGLLGRMLMAERHHV